MDRIVGIETEYGCLLSEDEPHVNSELWPAKVKNYLFRKADAGTFGRRTTLPSGCMKNLTRSPGFSRKCSRIAFGIVACPLVVIADSTVHLHYILK